jgi:hypothetical protein
MGKFGLVTKKCRIVREVRQGAFSWSMIQLCIYCSGVFAELHSAFSSEIRYKELNVSGDSQHLQDG